MPNLPNDPLTVIPEPERNNGDMPGGAFPGLTRIAVDDLVGPVAANRQHQAMERRSLVLRDAVNQLIQLVNVIDTLYLRKDNSQAKDGVTGPLAHVSWNAKKIIDLAAGTLASGSGDAATAGQLYDAIQALTALVDSLTGGSFSITRDISGLLKLVNDTGAPPGNAYYGTNASGTRGFFSLPATAAAAPNQKFVISAVGTFSFTVPVGVTRIFAQVRGARGGDGGYGTGYTSHTAGWLGAIGGNALGALAVTPGETLSGIVGGRGVNGPNARASEDWTGGGGGGGCGSKVVRDADGSTLLGGGGGGGGGGEGSNGGGAGGNGGQRGSYDYISNIGGAAGSPLSGISSVVADAPGIGGARADGSPGLTIATGWAPGDGLDWLDRDGAPSNGNGLIVLRWYSP